MAETHCVKSVRIWSFFGPYFPAFALNTEICKARLCICLSALVAVIHPFPKSTCTCLAPFLSLVIPPPFSNAHIENVTTTCGLQSLGFLEAESLHWKWGEFLHFPFFKIWIWWSKDNKFDVMKRCVCRSPFAFFFFQGSGLIVIQLNEEGQRSMHFDDVEGVVEYGYMTLCVKIPELFILSYHLILNIEEKFTVCFLYIHMYMLYYVYSFSLFLLYYVYSFSLFLFFMREILVYSFLFDLNSNLSIAQFFYERNPNLGAAH